ncbi:MAG: polysaccharide deacetylase family protein, partial [Nitrospirae bacterium]|nr:polysaccharide deacetylase family protein [Nitrospirota bacterium]
MARALILSYHCIAKPLDNALTPNNFVTPGMFGFQMWFLRKAGFTVISIKDMVKYTLGQLDVKMPVSLTFDDGYQDFYDNAYPVLRKYAYPSTVFVVSSLVGKENTWGGTKKLPVLKLMDWETLARVSEGGVDIGSHTRTHPSCSAIDAVRLWDEIAGSK